jgi:hypothetical protein
MQTVFYFGQWQKHGTVITQNFKSREQHFGLTGASRM